MTPARTRRGRPAARGYGLIELMIASVILIVAMVGFLGAMREAINATAVAHRRTEATLLRTGLLERLAVSRRDWVAPLAGLGWVAESCYRVDGTWLADNPGVATGAWVAGFTCPTPDTMYRRFLSATSVPDATGAAQRIWTVATYVERVDQPCTPATRYQSLGCVGADHYLTD